MRIENALNEMGRTDRQELKAVNEWQSNLQEDYKKFIQMFARCENVEAAHKLSAHIFGIQHVQHFKVNCPRSTDSINSSVFDELPSEYELKPHIRTYKPRIHKSGFESKELEKLAQLLKTEKRAGYQEHLIDLMLEDIKVQK